jgi:hypothetical protein
MRTRLAARRRVYSARRVVRQVSRYRSGVILKGLGKLCVPPEYLMTGWTWLDL